MDNFANHVARYWHADMGGRIEKIIFSQPGHSNYYVEFISYRGILVVTGDLYDAIYEVSCPQTMSWWAGVNADYLNGKMRGPDGYSKEREVWDHEAAEKGIKRLYAELVKETRESDEEVPQEDGPAWDKWLQELDDMPDRTTPRDHKGLKAWREHEPKDHIGDEHEWKEFCREHAEEIWGPDWWDGGGISNLGMIDNPINAVHLEALQRALAQLKEKGVQVQETAEATAW